MLRKKIAGDHWQPLLKINWKLQPYEMVLLGFALIVCVLEYSYSPMPLSGKLASVFVMKVGSLVLVVYGLSILIVGYRMLRHGITHGKRSCFVRENFIALVLPYWSLDFLLLTIRRTFTILAIIYFFLHLKHIILLVNTKNYDLFYWNLDRALHFGTQPNITMMQLIGPNRDISILLDFLYIKYFTFKILVSLFFLMELKGRDLSRRYFTAYALLWALGGLAYLVAPADGPCFSVLTHFSVEEDDLFHVFKFPITTEVPLSYIETYVNAAIPSAKGYQILLWEARHIFLSGQGLPGMFYGIAAMPSLHVAAITLLSIFLFQAYPLLGLLGGVFAIITFIGSIFLQWHYAIDGYIGFAMAVLTCWVCLRGYRPEHSP